MTEEGMPWVEYLYPSSLLAQDLRKLILHEYFAFTRGSDCRVCLLSGTRMATQDALNLINHFQSRATLEPTLHQARVKTRVSRVETLLCFLETVVTRGWTRVWKKKLHVISFVKIHWLQQKLNDYWLLWSASNLCDSCKSVRLHPCITLWTGK